jgi:hypothetical protein
LKSQTSKFTKIRPARAAVLHADRLGTDVTKLRGALRDYAVVPKNANYEDGYTMYTS